MKKKKLKWRTEINILCVQKYFNQKANNTKEIELKCCFHFFAIFFFCFFFLLLTFLSDNQVEVVEIRKKPGLACQNFLHDWLSLAPSPNIQEFYLQALKKT